MKFRDSSKMVAIGRNFYLFGGCNMEQCMNDLLIFQTDNACPLRCSSNGICRNNRCICSQGFTGD